MSQTENPTAQNPVAEGEAKPSREEVIQFYKEQIEMREYQVRLQQLNADYATARVEEMRAIAYMAQMTQQPADAEGGKVRNLKKES